MIKVALLDGPIRQGFNTNHSSVNPAELHAQAVKAAILSTNPHVDIIAFPIFKHKLSTSREVVLEALYAAMASDAEVLHCSFGFAQADDATQKAFSDAVSRFDCVVASSPARGQPVFPASYPGVLKASGDARLRASEHSWLDSPQVDFAANPRPPEGFSAAGASIGAARVSGIITAKLATGTPLKEVLIDLQTSASFRGNERKSV